MKKGSTILWVGPALLALAACSPPAEPTPEAVAVVETEISVWEAPDDDPVIEAGRQVWLGTCIKCHAHGLAGAPPIGEVDAWAPRIAQGLPVLFEHALQGFAGKTGGEMPARGGNPDLDDEQVTRAVRFMVSRSQG